MNYVIKGKVIKGDGYGRKLGFPTVNLDVNSAEVGLRQEGVYAGTALLDGKQHRAGIVVGPGAKIEAHLIDYEGDAYGKEVTLELQKFLRGYKKFDTEEALIIQIKKDISLC